MFQWVVAVDVICFMVFSAMQMSLEIFNRHSQNLASSPLLFLAWSL